jgi:hypothetical protein
MDEFIFQPFLCKDKKKVLQLCSYAVMQLPDDMTSPPGDVVGGFWAISFYR